MNIRHAGIGILKSAIAAVVAVALTTTLGCGDANRSSVTGKVTAGDAPVTGGTLSFAPVGGGGKPAMIAVGSDGSYDLSGDGVHIGKNTVTFMAPPPKYAEGVEPKPGDEPEKSPFEGMKVATPEVEVKSGANTIDIELVK